MNANPLADITPEERQEYAKQAHEAQKKARAARARLGKQVAPLLLATESGKRFPVLARRAAEGSIRAVVTLQCIECMGGVRNDAKTCERKSTPRTRWLRWTSMHATGGGTHVSVRVPTGGESTEDAVAPWEDVVGPFLKVAWEEDGLTGSVKVALPAPSTRGVALLWVPGEYLSAELPPPWVHPPGDR